MLTCSGPDLQEMRKGKYLRSASSDRDVLHTTAELHLPVESTAGTAGITLLPASTVEQLLLDKRRLELVQPFKLALLKLSSQVCKPCIFHRAAANVSRENSSGQPRNPVLPSRMCASEAAPSANLYCC